MNNKCSPQNVNASLCYLLSIEMVRLFVKGATVSLFSLAMVGSEAEEEAQKDDEEDRKMEAAEFSLTESIREDEK